MERPLILVTNDDGINAPGIRTLISIMKDIGDIVVVAPDSPQSGMGHAITINSTLHSSRITPKDSEITEYSCSGTPADCVKLAINELMPRKPDLCVSGINHGSNSSINVIYSGTMSAAIEAGIEALNNGIPKGVVLNVNIPSVRKSDIKGVKICRQAMAYWIEEFDKRKNPLGQEYYWLTGKFINEDLGEDTDEWALNNNFISIVPVKFDLTAHHAIKGLNQWNFK